MTAERFNGPYIIKYVNEWPNEELKQGEVVVHTSITHGYCSYHCPCGSCGKLFTNLSQEQKDNGTYKGCWTLKSHNIGDLLDLSPSIQRNSDCHSHFFIKDGMVQWC